MRCREAASVDLSARIEQLRSALLQDRAKAEAALRDQKHGEIEARITKVQSQLQQENELALHEATLRWNALKRKVEDELKDSGKGAGRTHWRWPLDIGGTRCPLSR